MIEILREVISLFGRIVQILLRMGMTRGEKNNMSDAVRTLEEHVDDAEDDLEKKGKGI